MGLSRLTLVIVLHGCILYGNVLFAQEEFTGPFKSWANIKTRFGAKGDGITDDTKKIQQAIDQFANAERGTNIDKDPYVVLYFPSGTYLISETLLLKGKIGVTIIGEDPRTTIIKWIGKNKDTLLLANGSAYFKIGRFTWHANGRTGMEGVGVHWLNKWDDSKTRSYASLNIELSDMEFIGGFEVGIGGGTYYGAGGTGSNDSEITVRRCNFINCTDAGIKITGFNALDYWIWYCRFTGCRYGVYCSNGNYHVYGSYFKKSIAADLLNKGGYYTSVRESYSSGSKAFSKDEGSSCNPFKRIFQKNTVINCSEMPIEYYHLGNVTLLDNIFATSADKKNTSEINLGSWCPGFYSLLSLNNQYTYKVPIAISMARKKLMRYGDRQALRPKANAKIAEPQLPFWPVRNVRPVFEVPAGASSQAIQALINKAVALKGKKPIIHFSFGKYLLDQTIIIRAGSDLQITGDGIIYATQLVPKDPSRMKYVPLLLIYGPSSVIIKDLQIGTNVRDKYLAGAIQFRNIDQQGSNLILDQLYSSADTSLHLEGMNYLYVEKNNSFFSDGNYFSGGEIQQRGKGSFRINCNGGQFARLTVKNNAVFVSKDCWWEGQLRVPLEITGNGSITIDGGMIAPVTVDSTPTIIVNKFRGKLALMNMYIQGGWKVDSSNDKLDLLCWNLHFYYKMNPIDIIKRSALFRGLFAGISSQCFDNKNPDCGSIKTFEPENTNIRGEEDFLKEMTRDLRSSSPVSIIKATSGHNSRIYLSRVCIGMADIAIKVVNDE